jgi:hypothetical protein
VRRRRTASQNLVKPPASVEIANLLVNTGDFSRKKLALLLWSTWYSKEVDSENGLHRLLGVRPLLLVLSFQGVLKESGFVKGTGSPVP